MPRRFTVTEKWDKAWFTQLSPWSKLVFCYLCDRCDVAGFYEVNVPLMSAQIGLTSDQITKALDGLCTEFHGERKVLRREPYLWLVNFVRHQRNLPLNPENRAHQGIIKSLAKHSGYFGCDLRKCLETQQLPSPLEGAKKRLARRYGKGNGNGKGVGGTGEGGDVAAEFEQDFWPNVPNKIDKKKARAEYISARKTTPKETILAGLPGYRAKEARRAKQAGYERHSPFRWLRDERWTDEIPEARSAATSAQKLCACGCGKQATQEVSNKGFATVECRKKVLEW